MAASFAHVLSQLPCWTSDTVLLERYVHQRDEAAFAALVSRHGALVLRLCRRILGDAHAAEDAFQATFLILARKTHALKKPDALSAWLYGVARRVALKSRRQSSARIAVPVEDTLLDPHPDPLARLNARELLDILDEEVQRLPIEQRSAFLLCCLEGHTQEEAARMLGWTVGSIKGRLERGRRRLQARLQRRGIALSAALALVVLMRDRAGAHVPTALLKKTAHAALHGGVGNSATALAHSVLRAMLLPKLATAMVVTLTIALAASTTVALVHRSPTVEVAEDKKPSTAGAPQPADTGKPKTRTDALGDPLPAGALLRLGTIRYRAGAGINHAALSPDGKLLATACESGITIFDLATGKPRHLRESGVENGFDSTGSRVAFSPDGGQLINVTTGGNLRFWDAATGRLLRVLGTGGDFPDIAHFPRGGVAIGMMAARQVGDPRYTKVWFPPRGKSLIVGPQGKNRIPGPRGDVAFAAFIEPATGKVLRRFPIAGELASVAADGKTLVAIDFKRAEAILYDDHGKELRRIQHGDKIDPATLCQGGKRLVTVNDKAEIKVWDAVTGQEQLTIAGPAAKSAARTPTVVAIDSGGKTLFVGTRGGDILRWDLGSGKEIEPLHGHGNWVTGLFHAPDGSLVSVSWDNVIRRWKLPGGQAEPVGEGYAHHLSVARSPDGRTIASASYPRRLEFCDAATGKRLGVFSLPADCSSTRLRFAPDGKLLALGCADATIRLWDVDKGRVRHEWKLPESRQRGDNGKSWFTGMAWSPDGRFLAASMRGDGLRLWDATAGKELWHLARSSAEAVAFSPDGKTLVSGGWDRCITFHDPATGKARSVLTENRNTIDDLAFSPDGAVLATCHHGGNVYLRDPKTGVVRQTLQAHRQVAWSISFSPDSNWLASSGDYTVCVWEVATGAELLCLKGHEGRTTLAEFGNDGRTVLSSSHDLTALLWDVRPSMGQGRKRPLETLWTDLAAEPVKAYRAVWALAGNPKAASELLRKKIAPVRKIVDERRLQAILADLDSNEFAIRQKATEELETMGEQALPAYRKALEGKPPLESRRRLEDLQAKAQRSWDDLSGERLRSLRAIESLELADTKETREVLEALAAGAEGTRLTEQAKAASRRLKARRR